MSDKLQALQGFLRQALRESGYTLRCHDHEPSSVRVASYDEAPALIGEIADALVALRHRRMIMSARYKVLNETVLDVGAAPDASIHAAGYAVLARSSVRRACLFLARKIARLVQAWPISDGQLEMAAPTLAAIYDLEVNALPTAAHNLVPVEVLFKLIADVKLAESVLSLDEIGFLAEGWYGDDVDIPVKDFDIPFVMPHGAGADAGLVVFGMFPVWGVGQPL